MVPTLTVKSPTIVLTPSIASTIVWDMEHKRETAFDASAVRAEMGRRSINVEKLVELSGLSRAALDKILGPDGNPTSESITKIARALGVDVRLFFAPDSHHGVKHGSGGAA